MSASATRRGLPTRYWLPPVGIFVVASIATLVLWRAMLAQERAHVRRSVTAQVEAGTDALRQRARTRNQEVTRLADAMQNGSASESLAWAMRVDEALTNGQLRVVQLLDSSFAPRFVSYRNGDTTAAGLEPHDERERARVLAAVRTLGHAGGSNAVRFTDGAPGIIYVAPLPKNRGYVLAVSEVKSALAETMSALATKESAGYSRAVFSGDRLLGWSAAKGDGDTLGVASPWRQEVTVGSGSSTWRLRVWPSPTEVEHQRSPLPQVTLVVGLLLGLLLALATHLARTAELRARALSASHTRLEGEIAERERAEAALRASEAQLQQSQKMEAIGRLAGGIAHDFNNLLTAISGYSEFLLSDLDQDDPHREDVSEIKKAAGRAATLTSQLLAFSRRQIRQPRSLDLNVVVADLEKMMSRLIGEDIAFTTRFAQSLPAVYADPSQIEQIVLNLVINASDAMPHGGTITVATARELDATTGGSFVSLSVSDTGHGMDATTRARVFEPFFTTKEQGRGTGLGLSTVWAVVEQSGGTVRVESEPGLGSTFTVRLPAYADAAGTYVSNMLVTDAPTGTERVLLAEDEESVRALAARILERHGYTVLQAKDGYEALAVAESAGGGIQLLLTDVVMPEMGGKRLADALLQQQPTARVLYMSGYTDGEISRRGELDPGTAFIQKPFTAAGLLAKVREVLDGPPSEELARRERLARAHATPMSTPAIRSLAVAGASTSDDDRSGD